MRVPRFHLFELEDLPWFPGPIRDLATDYLHFVETTFGLHRPVVPLLRDALRRAGVARLVDLCSGAGGPVPAVARELAVEGMKVQFTLTDRFPNLPAFRRAQRAFPDGVLFRPEPVDALAVPGDLPGFRTMFNSFHHLRPSQARAVLRDTVAARQPIGVFELSERTLAIIPVFLFVPLLVLAVTPFIRPVTWRRLFWTYVIPLVPLTCWWDGVVSQLRAYTVDELEDLADATGGGYAWTAGRVPVPSSRAHLTYLIGIPPPPIPEASS